MFPQNNGNGKRSNPPVEITYSDLKIAAIFKKPWKINVYVSSYQYGREIVVELSKYAIGANRIKVAHDEVILDDYRVRIIQTDGADPKVISDCDHYYIDRR